jgi:hypothetical protein
MRPMKSASYSRDAQVHLCRWVMQSCDVLHSSHLPVLVFKRAFDHWRKYELAAPKRIHNCQWQGPQGLEWRALAIW